MAKVLICGYYGAHNRGDELILSVLTNHLKAKNIDIIVTSLDPVATSSEYGVKTVKSTCSLKKGLVSFIREIIKADVFILGGGGLYQDYGKHFRVVFYYGLRVLIAGLLRKKIIYFALGVGNIELSISKIFIRFVTQMVNIITVRDEGSKAALTNMRIKKPISVCADPVFTIADNKFYIKAKTIKPLKRVGISILPYDDQLQFSTGADQKIEQAMIHFTSFLLEHNFDVTFIPMEKDIDDHFINKILINGNLSKSVTVLDSSSPHDVFIGNFLDFDIVVAMRLHSIIISSCLGIPFLPISYHSKVSNVASLLHQEDLLLTLNNISFDKLKSSFLRLVNSYDTRKNIIINRADYLRTEAQKSLDILDSLF